MIRGVMATMHLETIGRARAARTGAGA